MAVKTIKLRSDSKGFAHLGLLLLALVVIGAGGFAVWRITSYNNNSGANANGRTANQSSQSGTSASASAAGTNSATLSDECVVKTGDPNICHLGAISDLSQYSSEVHMTMDTGNGPLNSIVKYDGKGNSYVDTGTGALGMSVGGKYYVYMMDKWYDTGSDPSQAPKSNVPSFGFATTAGIKYENLGKEKCGDATCFKYKMTGGVLGDGVVTATFGDKDYLPRSINSTGGLLGNLTMTVEYKPITITAPAGALPISSLTAGYGQ